MLWLRKGLFEVNYEDFFNHHLLGCFGVLIGLFGGGGSYPPTLESRDKLIFKKLFYVSNVPKNFRNVGGGRAECEKCF